MANPKPLQKKSASDTKAQRVKASDNSSTLSKKENPSQLSRSENAPHLAKKELPQQQIAKKSAQENNLAKKESAPTKVQPAPYVQKKLSVSTPGDSHEQEADRVADEVVKRSSDTVSPGKSQPEKTTQAPQSLQTKISRVADTPTPAAPAQDAPTTESATSNSNESDQVSPEVEQQIESLRGQGSSLAEDVRTEMESQFSHDFSSVSIHTDAAADALCKQLSARAFTVGNDIFFASGEYAPTSQEGKRLLAHELTHVVQQGSGVTRKIYRSIDPADTPTGNADATSKLQALSRLSIPPIKQRHLPYYTQLANEGHLGRIANYTRYSPAQSEEWKSAITINETDISTKLESLNPRINWPIGNARVRFKTVDSSSTNVDYPKSEFLERIVKIPKWDRRGHYVPQYQVDHIVELQTAGDHGRRTSVGNSIQNMELLDQPSNGSSGSVIMNGISAKVDEYLNTLNPKPGKEQWLRDHDINFESVAVGAGGERTEGGSSWWTLTEITNLEHLNYIRGVPPQSLEGDNRRFVLASGPGGVEIARYNFTPNSTQILITPINSRAVGGLEIQSINLSGPFEQDNSASPVQIGTVTAKWKLPDKWQPANEQVTLTLNGLGHYAGYLLPPSSLTADFAPTSPSVFNNLSIGAEGVTAGGSLTPSIPMLRGMDFALEMIGDDIVFRATYSPTDLHLDFPGLRIYDGSISLSYGRRQGFGVEGMVMMEVPNLGDGQLTVGYREADGFYAQGNFNFDSKLFDRARVSLWYRNRAFGGEGTIGIDSPDKIKGIRSANLTIGFDQGNFTATGEVQPNIPGVQQAGLTVSYNRETGLTIGGNLQLNSDTPGIQSGSIDVTLNKQDGEWKVAATGTAVPAIPGINSLLTINYNDGAFTAEVSADYSRGMLSGTVNAGVTNRTVGEDGNLSATAEPNNPLIVYGGGSLTLQIAPWLRGTAGVQFAPNGEVTVTGEIGLPSQLEIFARQEINRSIFNIAIQAPIFPGIVAEVGGGLSATAGIGPGVIDQLRLGITYNPAHEDQTTITGDAHLNIPANAGLRLSVRAGIGLGITGASATGGIDIGGILGIEGAAEAGVHLNWSPATGLDITANIGIHAQPSFTFDIGGYVSVRALGFSVYDNRWQFASYTFGSDYRFGISLPIHYHEGEPFNISLDDVQFEVPDIDTNALLRGLIARIA